MGAQQTMKNKSGICCVHFPPAASNTPTLCGFCGSLAHPHRRRWLYVQCVRRPYVVLAATARLRKNSVFHSLFSDQGNGLLCFCPLVRLYSASFVCLISAVVVVAVVASDLLLSFCCLFLCCYLSVLLCCIRGAEAVDFLLRS